MLCLVERDAKARIGFIGSDDLVVFLNQLRNFDATISSLKQTHFIEIGSQELQRIHHFDSALNAVGLCQALGHSNPFSYREDDWLSSVAKIVFAFLQEGIARCHGAMNDCIVKDKVARPRRDCICHRRTVSCFDFMDNAADREVFRSYCDFKQFESGDMLCHEGELSDAVYFVNSGSFDVIKPLDSKPGRRLAKISVGAMVGEMALYTGKARTASIQATVPSSAYILSKLALARMRAELPELVTRFEHMVIRKVSESLARSNQLVTTLR